MRIGWIVMMAVVGMVAAPSFGFVVKYSDSFDSDTNGSFPSGWTPALDTTNTFVKTDAGARSQPNLFQLEQNGSTGTEARVTFPSINLDVNQDDLYISMDLNVAQIDPVPSQSPGFRVYPSSAADDLGVGIIRILGAGNTTQWVFNNYYSGGSPTNSVTLNVGQWYHVDMYVDATANSGGFEDGVIKWYIDGSLAITVPYHDSLVSRLQNIDRFVISQNGGFQGNPATPPILYLDNLIIGVPEPASIGLLAAGLCALIRRRRK